MKGLQLIIAFSLLVLVFQVESQPTIRQCDNPGASFHSCNTNSVLRVTKSAEMYQVTLLATEWQCLNDFCLLNNNRHRQKNILCNETCRACHQLKPMSDCGTDNEVCEINVDTYLNDFCALATFTRNSATICNATSKLPCPTSTITNTYTAQTATVTVSATLPHQCNYTNPMTSATPRPNIQCHAPSPSESTNSQILASDCKPLENYQYPLVALGALQGLSLVVLALVTTGWVCTCRSMKKRVARESSTCIRTSYVNAYDNDDDDGDDDEDKTNEERLFQNPTYDDTHTSHTAQPYEEMALGSVEPLVDEGIPETTYDSVNLPTQSAEDDRQMYDVLNRSQANGGSNLTTETRRVHNNANYSQLQGLQENI